MKIKDIKNITIAEAIEAAEKGIYFIIKDGMLKGFTK